MFVVLVRTVFHASNQGAPPPESWRRTRSRRPRQAEEARRTVSSGFGNVLVAMPGAPSSFLVIVVRPGAPSSIDGHAERGTIDPTKQSPEIEDSWGSFCGWQAQSGRHWEPSHAAWRPGVEVLGSRPSTETILFFCFFERIV